ncbi:MAG: GNAT family N-acetyltransferase [Chloroflexota bacterium]
MTIQLLLRDVLPADLPFFFDFQRDVTANHMAAFTAKDPTDRAAFNVHWARIMGEDSIKIKTTLLQDKIVGYVLQFEIDGKPEISYWVGTSYWGKGIATQALALFLKLISVRPIYARAAKDNFGSIRVLEKCGFVITGHETGYANARGAEIEEVVLKLQ